MPMLKTVEDQIDTWANEAEEAIRDILCELENKTGKSIDAVTVDTRNYAAYRTEITFR